MPCYTALCNPGPRASLQYERRTSPSDLNELCFPEEYFSLRTRRQVLSVCRFAQLPFLRSSSAAERPCDEHPAPHPLLIFGPLGVCLCTISLPGGPESCLCPSHNSLPPFPMPPTGPRASSPCFQNAHYPTPSIASRQRGSHNTRHVVARKAKAARVLGRRSPDRPAMRPDRGKGQKRDAMAFEDGRWRVVPERPPSHICLRKTTRYGPEVRFTHSCVLPRGCSSWALADPQSHRQTQNAPS